MVRGRLRCLGTSLRLKSRFGSGYRISIRIRQSKTSKLDSGSVSDASNVLAEEKARIKSLFTRRLGVQSGKSSILR